MRRHLLLFLILLSASYAGPADPVVAFYWDLPQVATSGVPYTVTVSAYTNIAGNISVYKNGFYFAGGPGFTASRTTTDHGVQTIVYRAEQYDPFFDMTGGSDERSVQIVAATTTSEPTASLSGVPSSVSVGQSFTVGISAHDDDGDIHSMGIRMATSSSVDLVGGPWMVSGYDASNSVTIVAPDEPLINIRAEVWDSGNNGFAGPWQTVYVSAPQYKLTVAGGTISPGGATTGYYRQGEYVDIVADAASVGTYFSRWQVSTGPSTSFDDWFAPTTRFRMGAGESRIYADFSSMPRYELTVVSNPDTHFDYSMLAGSVFNIRAMPVGDAVFVKWILSGAGTIANPNSIETTFTAGAGNATVTAEFFSASISVTPTSASAPALAHVLWSSSGADSVEVTGDGITAEQATLPCAPTPGYVSVSGLRAGTHIYTIKARRGAAVIVGSAALTVTANAAGPETDTEASIVAVGSLTSEVSVDNHGAANCSIPLQCPPGRAGLEPQLSLNYSSTAGNGPLGIGWTLSTGFPVSITRGRTILARDGQTRGPQFDDSNSNHSLRDNFYLDGRRLIYVGGGAGPGTPGSEYRTEVDTFSLIKATGSDGNIEAFTVREKSGRVLVFGKHASTDDAYHEGGNETQGKAYAYALKRVSDTLGNYAELTYDNKSLGEHPLTSIAYTGGSESPRVTIDLSYNVKEVAGSTARRDASSSFIARRRFDLTQRLDRIRATVTGESVPVVRYALSYDYAPEYGPTRLRKVEATLLNPSTGQLNRLKPTNLEWTSGEPTAAPAWSYSTVTERAIPWNTFPSNSNESFAFGDVNGDGKDDLVNLQGPAVVVRRSTGTGLGPEETWAATSVWPGPQPVMKLCDVNGDGRKDIVFGNPLQMSVGPYAKTLRVLLSTGSSFTLIAGGTAPFNFTNEFADPKIPSDASTSYNFEAREGPSVTARITAADFTGDGRDDILIHRYDGRLQLLESTGTGFIKRSLADVGASSLSGSPEWELFSMRFLGFNVIHNFSVGMIPCDLNGDGVSDYAWTETTAGWGTSSGHGTTDQTGGKVRLFAVTSKPDGGFSPKWERQLNSWSKDSSSNIGLGHRANSVAVFPADVNGDGLTDFVTIEPGWDVWGDISNGGAYPSNLQVVLEHQIFLSTGSPDKPEFEWSRGGVEPILQTHPRYAPANVGLLPTPAWFVNIKGNVIPAWWDKFAFNDWAGRGYSMLSFENDEEKRLMMASSMNTSTDNMAMTDVNGDGKADYVWYVDKPGIEGWYAMYSLGYVFSPPVRLTQLNWFPTARFESDYPQNANVSIRMPLDFNGDGITDYAYDKGVHFSTPPGVAGFHISQGNRRNDLLRVTNGLNSSTKIHYLPITNDSIYTAGSVDNPATPNVEGVQYPIREVRNGTFVVSDLEKDSGGGIPAHFTYQYSGNRVDVSGRGSLGFHSFVTLDMQTKIFKYQFLVQSFPMTGLTHREETYRWLGGQSFNIISSHDNTVVFDKVVTGGGATLWPFISKAVEYRWEDGAGPLTSNGSGTSADPESLFSKTKPYASAHIAITAKSWFDAQSLGSNPPSTLVGTYQPSDTGSSGQNVVVGTTSAGIFNDLPGHITYGNLRKVETSYGDGYSETVTTAYLPPTSNGITGLVDTVTTAVVAPVGGTQVAPVKSYTYWNNGATPTPLVASESIKAGAEGVTNPNPKLSTTTTYERDTRGRVTKVSITGSDLFAEDGGTTSGTDYTTYQATAFDDLFDLPTVELNAYLHRTTTEYDPVLGKPTSVTDANGVVVTTSYDALGRPTEITRITDDVSIATTNAFAWPDTLGVGPWKAAQPVAPPSGMSGDDGLSLSSVYAMRSETTAQPPVTSYYDRLGRLVRVVKEGFRSNTATTDYAYNQIGQKVGTSLPSADTSRLWTRVRYDVLGRVMKQFAPNGTVTDTAYDGRLTTVSVDAPDLGGANSPVQINTTLVDAKGRTVKVWNADNPAGGVSGITGSGGNPASISFGLDGFGRMRQTLLQDVDDAAHRITAQYDALGRQTQLVDPDKGEWNYINSALGYVLRQTDARLIVTGTRFDKLGRPLIRTTSKSGEPTETARWYYYDAATSETPTEHHVAKVAGQGWIGALQREESETDGAPGYAGIGTNSITKTIHYYDTRGNPSTDLTTSDSKWFHTSRDYDSFNRLQNVTHHWRPAGLEAPNTAPYVWQDFGYAYTYDNRSYLLNIQDTTATPRSWWKADEVSGYDHLDRPVLVQKGSGHWTKRTYRPEDGVLTAIKTGASPGSGSIQNLSFNYDGLGNLTERTGSGGNETFTYDELNRLTSDGQGAISYEDNGNISNKIGVGGETTAKYDYFTGTRPHAVKTAFGYAMTYDENGNLATRTKGTETWSLSWTGFDKPRWMAKNGTGSEFLYNANRSRTVQLEFDQMSNGEPSQYVRKRIYGLGSTLEANYEARPPSASPAWDLKKVRIYVPGPDGVIGAREFSLKPDNNWAEDALVYHYDHLGSIDVITKFGESEGIATDTAGKTGRFSEDAWGQRRDPLDWSGPPTSATDDGGHDSLTPRGFTGHEMLDDLGLVHMNGRIYDPLLGRFLSADIVVQAPGDLQAYNRYSYVRNNPLTLTDPSGFVYGDFEPGTVDPKAVVKAAEALANNKVVQGVGTTVAGFVPYVGDTMDAKDVVSPGSSAFERSVAGASLTVNAFTGGLAPNAGPIMRGLRQIGSGFADLFRGGSDASKAASDVAGAGAHAVGNTPTPHVEADAPKPEPVEVSRNAPTTELQGNSGGNGSSGNGDSGSYLYRTISKDDPNAAAFTSVGDFGSVSPKGGHSDIGAHVAGNTDSAFTSWSLDQKDANWKLFGGDSSFMQLRIKVDNVSNPGVVDVSEFARDTFKFEEFEVLIKNKVNEVERIK